MLTVAQAAQRLDVSGHEVRRLIRAGTLSANRVGRTLVLDDEEVAGRARLPIGAGRALAASMTWATLWELTGLRGSERRLCSGHLVRRDRTAGDVKTTCAVAPPSRRPHHGSLSTAVPHRETSRQIVAPVSHG
jgi:excisionase family DNA binding protein